MSTALKTRGGTSLPTPLEPGISPGHTLLFYENDSALLDNLSQSICGAICSGNSAIVVATSAHHNGLEAFLRERCPNAHSAIVQGRLFLLDSEEILSKIVVGGQLDPDRAISVLGNYVAMLSAAARTKDPQVFAFGELVSILWERGNQKAALHLELLCRQLGEHGPLQLCCGYPLRLFPSDTGPTPIVKISARRTQVLRSHELTSDSH